MLLQCEQFAGDFNDSFNGVEISSRVKSPVRDRTSWIAINPGGWTSSLKYHMFRVFNVINPGFVSCLHRRQTNAK